MATDRARSAGAKPRHLVLADRIYDVIRAMILDHKISPGEHVGIDDLARELSVSQTPVREALARLEADGLVTKIPLRGYEATDLLTVQQFDDLFRFRSIIEPWAAEEAARRSTPREIDALDAELAHAEALPRIGSGSLFTEFVEHDTRFHALVAGISGNPFVEDAFLRTHCHMHLFRVYRATMEDRGSSTGAFVHEMFEEYYHGGSHPLALTEHTEITDAIRDGDRTAARELMLRHIESSRQRFIPAVEALNGIPDRR